jgi:hypothetical protein
MGRRRHIPKPAADSPSPDPAYRPGWLKRFLWGLAIAAAALTVTFWGYALWGHAAVAAPARDLVARGDPQSLRDALLILETVHLFSGVEAYAGIGPESSAGLLDKARKLLRSGRDYDDPQARFLIRHIAFYIPAFKEVRITANTPLVPGDARVIGSLLSLWENAQATTVFFACYLTLVSLLLAAVPVLYSVRRLWNRI